ncbi:Dyp-type peroxidase [Moraxella boevrei]|uniref:Dyp-type peroxidase n=1 Tax=Faucicola boevrei TaxID=346665 RepID=UPI003735C928
MSNLKNRRQFLQNMGVASLAGATLLTGCDDKTQHSSSNNLSNNTAKGNDNDNPKHAGSDATSAKNCFADKKYEFYDTHQSGILTPVQRHVYFLVMDLHSTDVKAIAQMFKDWTDYSVKLMKGENILPYSDNPHVPPTDTGEADSLSAYGLTLTFGISPSFLQKLNLTDKAPPEFSDLPNFPRDQIRPELSGGDICVQACADDPQVAFHAVRQLVRQARSLVTMKWSQTGYNAFDTGHETPRNLFGFKDGTANKNTLEDADKWLWIDEGVFKNGTYLVARIIQMHLETWDRTSLQGQEDTFGRHRESGASIGKTGEFDEFDVNEKNANGKTLVPDISHMGLAKRTGLQMLRRSYSYASGIDAKTGQFNAGLLFISFQKSPMQFSVIQNAFGKVDKMNEYTTHIGSGLFLCFGGVKQGEYLGQALFESQ